jgi:hypothetical protein
MVRLSGVVVIDQMRSEAVHHFREVREMLVEGRIDDANDYLDHLSAYSRLCHDLVIRLIELATGIRYV